MDSVVAPESEVAPDSVVAMNSMKVPDNVVASDSAMVPDSIVAMDLEKVLDSIVAMDSEEVPDSVVAMNSVVAMDSEEVPDSVVGMDSEEVVLDSVVCGRCGLLHEDYDMPARFLHDMDKFDCEFFIPDVEKLEMRGETIVLPEHVIKKLEEKLEKKISTQANKKDEPTISKGDY
ncbi:hypothetical protein SORBI_3010G116650 [Sorghum bicolor]|uniref:Uncharacterized protein n=1 Tax=Sorghum bicolor TaxID=4558 RepID=A0A1W0VSH0_SORBI|nr:hypothetical protein SORBI_3010G116650 [Sorghum bicolor]